MATRTHRLEPLALALLGIGALASIGEKNAMIPAPPDLWTAILDGGFFGLLVIIASAFFLDWVRPTKTVKQQLADAIGPRDERINAMAVELTTLRENRARSADRTDRLADSQEVLTQVLSILAAQKQAGP